MQPDRLTWTIDTSDQTAGITAVIETGAAATAKSVRIRHPYGFTGSYWLGNHGNTDASRTVSTWTISGTIDGFNIDTPAVEHATRHFTLKANC